GRSGCKITIWGGDDGASYLNTGACYDSGLYRWKILTPVWNVEGRSYHTQTGGVIFGGYNGAYLNSTVVCDDSSCRTSTPQATPPSPRAFHTAASTTNGIII